MNRIIKLNGKLQPLPKAVKGIQNTGAYSLKELRALGLEVYDYVTPEIGILQRQGDLIIKNGKATHEVLELEITNQELYDQKKERLYAIVNEFKSLLINKATGYILKNQPPPEIIQQMTIGLEAKLMEEKAELQGYLDTDNRLGLYNYLSDPTEHETLREQIKSL